MKSLHGASDHLVISNLYDWSCEAQTCLLLSLRVVSFLQCLEFVFIFVHWDCAGAVAPDFYSGTVTTSFVGCKLRFLSFFFLFWGVTYFA